MHSAKATRTTRAANVNWKKYYNVIVYKSKVEISSDVWAITCVASVSSRVRRESWGESKKKERTWEGEG